MALTILFCLLGGRFFYVQVLWQEELNYRALDQWTREIPIVAERGKITDQFGSNPQARTESVRASVLAPEKPVDAPVLEQTPQVTEYVRARIETPVFTTDKFNHVTDASVAAPVIDTPVAPMPVEVYAPTEAVAQEAQYSLSRMAKTVIAAFAATVVAMLSLIGVNSHIIRQKTVRIQNLEEKRQELLEKNAEIQRRIEIAQSEETIREYALSQGMILGD